MQIDQPDIRRGTAADAAVLAPFAAFVFAHTFAADSDPDRMRTYLAESFAPQRIAAELADPAALFLLAELGGALCGYAKLTTNYVPECVRAARPIGLARLYVAPAQQGRGTAHALMRACLDLARQRGHTHMWLGVWDRNLRARAFYAKYGFREVGAHAFYFVDEKQSDLVYLADIPGG